MANSTKPTQEDTPIGKKTMDQQPIVNALASIEKLLKLLGDHCKVCPSFAEEFEKLNLN